jgi:hypothetical protein
VPAGNGSSIAGWHHTQRLGGGHLDACQGGRDTVEQRGNTAAKRLRAGGDGEGDKDDKHGIFGRRGTALITAVAIDQTKHLKFLPASEAWPYCQCAPKGDPYRHSADAQINRAQSAGCPSWRQKTAFSDNFI